MFYYPMFQGTEGISRPVEDRLMPLDEAMRKCEHHFARLCQKAKDGLDPVAKSQVPDVNLEWTEGSNGQRWGNTNKFLGTPLWFMTEFQYTILPEGKR